MKKYLFALCTMVMLIISTAMFASCGDGGGHGEPHTHTYDQKNLSDDYIKSDASCNGIAVYYYSCACGEMGESTFEHKGAEKHEFEKGVCNLCGAIRYSTGLEFSSNGDGTCYVAGIGDCADTEIIIPPTSPDGNSVTGIGPSAFMDCGSLVDVVMPKSISRIGQSAFRNCFNLTSITVPEGIKFILDNAFLNCYKLVEVINHSSIDIKAGSSDHGAVALYAKEVHKEKSKIVGIDGYLFYTYEGVNYLIGYVGDEAVLTLPDSYNGQSYEINSFAFYADLRIVSVTVPMGVTAINNFAFSECYKLLEVINKSSLDICAGATTQGRIALNAKEVSKGESKFCNISDYLFYTYGGVNYLVGYVGDDTELTLPESYNGQEYEIHKYALYENTRITRITVADKSKITRIGSRAFDGCTGLVSIELGEDGALADICDHAFEKCTGLTSITVPNSVKSIEVSAFGSCDSLEQVTLPFLGGNNTGDNASSLSYIFGSISPSLKTVIITGGEAIGENAFYKCDSLTSITLPESITTIGKQAFCGCESIKAISIPKSVVSIGYAAFADCINLSSVEVAENSDLASVEDYAFLNCRSLENIAFINNGKIARLGMYAFSDCDGLTQISLPDSITEIGKVAFGFCDRLTDVELSKNSKLTSIVDSAFVSCTSLERINIPESVTSIEHDAFASCVSLTSITVPSGVTSIDEAAFAGCFKLVEVINKSKLDITAGLGVAKDVKEVHKGNSKIVNRDGYLFYSYDGINYLLGYIGDDTNLVLPNDYNGKSYEIHQYAFSYSKNITSAVIPASVTAIGSHSFAACPNLVSVEFDENIRISNIARSTFNGCSSLSQIVIPEGVASISDYAFYNCASLTSITIPDSVIGIGDSTFRYCISLTSVMFENTKGWSASTTSIASSDLSNTSTAAKYLTDIYSRYYWNRS